MKEEAREVTCILCPIGCKARVSLREGTITKIENLECPRGEDYVRKEVEGPVRDFFTTVRVTGARIPVLPVRATKPVPKGRLSEIASELAKMEVKAPVELGDVIARNVLNLGVDIVATRKLAKL